MAASVAALEGFRMALDTAYGACAEDHRIMQIGGDGTLADIIAFCRA